MEVGYTFFSQVQYRDGNAGNVSKLFTVDAKQYSGWLVSGDGGTATLTRSEIRKLESGAAYLVNDRRGNLEFMEKPRV